MNDETDELSGVRGAQGDMATARNVGPGPWTKEHEGSRPLRVCLQTNPSTASGCTCWL